MQLLKISLNKTGTANGTVAVSGTGTKSRSVRISSITGNGTLGISIKAGTACDNSGKCTAAAGPSDTFDVVNDYFGDVDGTMVVDIKDAVIALQVLSGVTPAQPVYMDADIDIDGDGRIGLAEVIYILQKVAGMR